MKRFLLFMFVSFLLFSCSRHPALRILQNHQKLGKTNSVIPYTINLYAIHDLQKGKNSNIKPYLQWVLRNLNYPDKHGLTGSIYDKNITIDGIEFSTGGYDSIDSYSATFLILLQQYFMATGDKKFLKENEKKIMDIAYTIAYLQDKDGLTTALPGSDIKYFMDNCEVHAGLKSFVLLSETMDWDLEEFYSNSLTALENGIQQKFYNAENNNFNWAVDDETVHTANWGIHYPDAYAQLFPIAYNLVFIDKKIKDELWVKYVKLYRGNKIVIPPEQRIIVEFAEERMEK